MSADILIIDDEADIRDLVAGILEDEGHQARTAANADAALQEIATRRPSLVFLDIWIQGSRLDGLQLLDVIKEQHADLPVVMISGHGNIETAVSAIKRGAYDFIEKPFKADRLLLVAERAIETSKLKREVRELKTRNTQTGELIGHSVATNQLRQTIEKVAVTNARVLIAGPHGAGKEWVARQIHAQSSRAGSPFVVISAATMNPDTVETALFGVEDKDGRINKIGALEEAHNGTLYLDEICDMPLATQSKILRVLVEQTFNRVGGSIKVQVDVRIISSTARDVAHEVKVGRLREDLLHRLNVFPLRVPSLAERREDVPSLISHFITQLGEKDGLPPRIITNDAMAVLQSYDWPGNMRQLRNTVERLMILNTGTEADEITADLLPPDVGTKLPSLPSGDGGEKLIALPLREARELFEREYLIAQLGRFGGNISRTAEFVGMERSALHRKLKSLGVE
jgi:two-component system nitrogen regulation response regulator NtrX